jgi:hypothetical protein
MQDISLSEGLFRSDYHHTLINISKNSKEILKKLQVELQKDGDISILDDCDTPLPKSLKIPIAKKK